MALEKCPECGDLIVDGLEECPYCGHRMIEPQEDETAGKQQKLTFLLLLSPVILVVITLLALLFRHLSS